MRHNASVSVTSQRIALARTPLVLAVALVAVAIGAAAWVLPLVISRGDKSARSAADFATAIGGAPPHADGDHEHASGDGHDHAAHDHDGHDDVNSLELSAQALKNIGYEPFTVVLRDFERSISLPGMVVERPGKTQYRVSAPLGGVITKVHVIEGETVAAGQPLFDVRLTHEELVSAQSEFLRTIEELDVVNREIARLEAITEGVVAGGRLRDQKYDRQKLEARLRAQRQALLLHGLSEAEVDQIVSTRLLLQSLTIKAPKHEEKCDCGAEQLFHVQSLPVQRGQQVDAGETLCVLADHCNLYIEGTAFEQDAAQLREAAASGALVSADLLVSDRREPMIEGLKILYLSDQVDRDSRAFHFYLTLPNKIALDRIEGGHRFLQWKFKPGQRVELRVPIEKWTSRLVVPAEAVVTDGSESYVFEKNGPHFDRVPVHVEYRDQKSAVIAADSALKPQAVIASRGAFQMNLDLKNKAGGGEIPHGHTH
ncbi:MAG: efflux RND transporter periplasmic adaptor subunit [Planctomycetaceae bacterium]|nr:efflux RND transporter periplasmic adaptor subunit [Planctomycetaceae bacterium]